MLLRGAWGKSRQLLRVDLLAVFDFPVLLAILPSSAAVFPADVAVSPKDKSNNPPGDSVLQQDYSVNPQDEAIYWRAECIILADLSVPLRV